VILVGQYFVAVNHTKREYVCPWCIGGVAKAVEWILNPQAAIFPYLLRRSDGTGGGDVQDPEALQYAGRWAGTDDVELLGDYHGDGGAYQEVYARYANISAGLTSEMRQALNLGDFRLETGCCGTCSERTAALSGADVT
jgi:hypothetical protein